MTSKCVKFLEDLNIFEMNVCLAVETWLLSTRLNLRDRVWGEGKKNSFIALSGKGGHSRLMPPKTVCFPQEDLVKSFFVF